MSVCRDLFLSRPGKPERVLKNTHALSVGNEFRKSLQHSARCATLTGHFGGIASLVSLGKVLMRRMEFNKSMTVAGVPRRQIIFCSYKRKTPVTRAFPGPRSCIDVKLFSVRKNS
jgi:hypothetical protein